MKGSAPSVTTGEPNAPEPWMARSDWAAGRIRSSTKRLLGIAWFLAVGWNGIAWGTAAMLHKYLLNRGNPIALLVCLFLVTGAVMLLWAVQISRRWVRYGESVFEMASVPGVIGESLQGTIRLKRAMRAVGPVHLRLICSRMPPGRRRSDFQIVWQHEVKVDVDNGDAIPVTIAIPENCPPTGNEALGFSIGWFLEARADVAGVNYVASFAVPIYAVEKLAKQREKSERLGTNERGVPAAFEQSRTSGIRVGMSRSGGLDVYFPIGRNAGVEVGLIVFGLFAVGMGCLFERMLGVGGPHQIEAPGTGGGRIVSALFFGFIALTTLYVACKLLLFSQRVEVDPDLVTVTNSIVGIKWSRKVPASEVSDIKTKIGFTFGPSKTPYQTIIIARKVGDDTPLIEEISAGSMIRDSDEADWLANEMKKTLKGNVT